MKIQNVFILILSLVSFQGIAQKGEPVILSVIYQFKHINDLNKMNNPLEQEMILRLGETESRYNNWTDETATKIPVKNLSSGNSAPKGNINYGFVPTVFIDGKGIRDFDLLQNPLQNKIVRVVRLGDSNYLIETPLPPITWKIYEERREIGGYTCQKAMCTYSGRTYVAWFAPKLPFRCGPWKLWGLPGLILEAKDLTGEVSFLFKELNKGESKESTALRIKRVVKVSEKAFDRAAEAFEKDPIAVYQSQLPIGITDKAQLAFKDEKGSLHYGDDGNNFYSSYKKDLKQRKNNPLELKK